MKKYLRSFIRLTMIQTLLVGSSVGPIRAAEKAAFAFFQEEAKVVTASRIAESRAKAPATTYVVTSADIKASGAQTIWDALRNVPGVDVIQTRTGQGEVS